MREVLVSDLVENLLGPRGGAEEVLDGTPLAEYVTGILSPPDIKKAEADDASARAESLSEMVASSPQRPSEKYYAESEEDDDTDDEISVSPQLSPVLDPKQTPPSMGITFAVSSEGRPTVDICVTWGRYAASAESSELWKRMPRYFVTKFLGKDRVMFIGPDGKEAEDVKDAETSLHIMTRKGDSRTLVVSVYVVNRVDAPVDGRVTAAHCIFQPQIRIVCGKGTRLRAEYSAGTASGDDEENEVLYRNKRSLARGHMTSAVWRGVDPEEEYSASVDFPERATAPGFAWADGGAVPSSVRRKFSPCDARTEYIPMHNVPAPDFSWPSQNGPELDAIAYAEEFDPVALRRLLAPFDTEYGKWIARLRSASIPNKAVKDRMIAAAEEVRTRIASGIDMLCDDEDARLSFCFASKAIDQQARWAAGGQDGDAKPATGGAAIASRSTAARGAGGGMRFRPFQIAFILMSAESALKPDSVHRKICDLLWVPTGGGKTEAYLFLVAMVAAYRRLRAAKITLDSIPGDGVSTISRYTLRLLTIQQFRRTVSLFAAMEFLRVDGLGEDRPVGWRPASVQSKGDFLWGTAQFSAGLWVGNTVTPKRLKSGGYKGRSPGAIDFLTNPDLASTHTDQGEPAQMLKCPACDSLLAVPDSGIEHEAKIHYVMYAGPDECTAALADNLSVDDLRVSGIKVTSGAVDGTVTVSAKLESDSTITRAHLVRLYDEIERRLDKTGASRTLAAAHPARPGYFLRTYTKAKGGDEPYDFQIFCPNPECPLAGRRWASGLPTGSTHGGRPDQESAADTVCSARSPDGNRFTDVISAFATGRHVADRIPIPAYTVDDQVHGQLPTMIVGTVDKFARIPFEPKSAALFGNVEYHHCTAGYLRTLDDDKRIPRGVGMEKNYIKLKPIAKPRHPDLIIQDEVHLVDGPLGSMFGMYETAVDALCSHNNLPVKYVASTATTRRSGDHVRALFDRDLSIFPPMGLDADDRFFVRDRPAHPLDDRSPGRLYVGVCSPGRGPHTPLVRIWSRLAQSAHEHRSDERIDPFWTLVGYFNTIRELAGTMALHMQDIPEWLRHLSESDPRPVTEEGSRDLSGRTPSHDLPAILDTLGRRHTGSRAGLDSLFTTSMFGTGVDVPRLGAMLVNGQPKTAAAYIQSTGRVGRETGGIVVTFYKATKPRDLNNYEFFVRQHSQLHRFVEPSTAFPFAKGSRDKAQGPVIVGLLRNMRRAPKEWAPKGGAMRMKDSCDSKEVKDAIRTVVGRSQGQPSSRRPREADVEVGIVGTVEKWRDYARRHDELQYAEDWVATTPVVLGSPLHEHRRLDVVCRGVPNSLRDIEDEVGFET